MGKKNGGNFVPLKVRPGISGLVTDAVLYYLLLITDKKS